VSAEPVRPLPPDGDESAPERGALDRALRLAAIREHSLLSLSELSQSLSASPDLFHMADLVLFNPMGQFGTPRSALWIESDTEGGPPVLIRAQGVNRPMAKALGMACAAPLRETGPEELGPFTPGDLGAWGGEALQVLAERAGFVSFARVPGRGRPLGLVALGARIGGQAYGPVEHQSLRAALSVLGVAVQNHRLVSRFVENNRQLRRANQELQELDRLKSEFLSNVNHELCTPLSIMMGYLESMLEGNSLDGGQQRRIMGVVLQEAVKLSGLLENLLTFADAQQGLLVLQMENVDAGEWLRRYCEDRLPGANARLREFAWRIEPDLPHVRFDEKRLASVVDALVDNAIKFTPEGSRVEVRAHRVTDAEGVWVAIEVADNGPGIPPERIPILFEAFRQADGSSTRTVGGMGIGLSFSRQLVNAMGGRLGVESELGRGATFTVLLPAP